VGFWNYFQFSHNNPGFFVKMNSCHIYLGKIVGFGFLINVLITSLNGDLMTEFEGPKQCQSRVSRAALRSSSLIPKVGLIFVHICEGLKHTRTKIGHIFAMDEYFIQCLWKPQSIFYFAWSAWIAMRLHTWTKIWRTFLLHNEIDNFISLQFL